MCWIIRILFIHVILCHVQQYMCRSDTSAEDSHRDSQNSTILKSYNDTFITDKFLSKDSVNLNHEIPRSIIDYPLATNSHMKYITDEEDYTSDELITFVIQTNQRSSQ
ncbi:unnamed protein product, partial [Adineta ricciae]